MPSSHEIDREYIEGETAEEIGEISQMTDIPDKAERHPHAHQSQTNRPDKAQKKKAS